MAMLAIKGLKNCNDRIQGYDYLSESMVPIVSLYMRVCVKLTTDI